MDKDPLVSVIIPCYNSERYIPDAIESVLNQTYQNIECIVVDDGSTDDTKKIVQKFVELDGRVRYYTKENGGVSSARNYGINRATGDLIQFLDSDDLLNPEKISCQIKYINEHNILDNNFVIYSDFEIVWYGENNEVIQNQTHRFGLLDKDELKQKIIGRKFGLDTPTPLSVCNTLFSKSILRDYKFNEKMFNYGDLEYFIKILQTDTKFYYTPVIGFYYRQRSDSISKDTVASRIGYLQFLEAAYDYAKDDLVYCPNMYEVILHFLDQRNKKMFNRAISLIKNSDIPVYTPEGKNIRNKVNILGSLKLYFPFLLIQKFTTNSGKKMKNIIKKFSRKILIRIGAQLHSLEGVIAQKTLPRFANNPNDIKIMLPRRIDHPENIYLGEDVSIGPGSLLKTVTQYPSSKKTAEKMNIPLQTFTPKLVIGNRVSATGSLQISALSEIIIDDDVMFASNIWICDGFHGYEHTDIAYKYQPMFNIAPIKIGRGCWIGQNVVIMPGVTIGEMSIIGANSVVTKNIPEKSIAVGSPARIVKQWDEETKRWQKINNVENVT